MTTVFIPFYGSEYSILESLNPDSDPGSRSGFRNSERSISKKLCETVKLSFNFYNCYTVLMGTVALEYIEQPESTVVWLHTVLEGHHEYKEIGWKAEF